MRSASLSTLRSGLHFLESEPRGGPCAASSRPQAARFQSSSTCAAAQDRVRVPPPGGERQREQSRARSAWSPHAPPRAPEGAPGMASRAAADGLLRLRGERRPLGEDEQRRRGRRGPRRRPGPSGPPAPWSGLPGRQRDRTADPSRDISRSPRRPARARRSTPSMMELASRVSGICAGSITSFCASHSSAIACAERARRRREISARRRLHRLAVEQNRETRRRSHRPQSSRKSACANPRACCAEPTSSGSSGLCL